jgi:periplasmic copper chaperone A
MKSRLPRTLLCTTAMLAGLLSAPAWAQNVEVNGAWARATVKGQKSSGAFMELIAHEPLRLVGVSTPVAGIAEIHQMKMEGDVMKMSAIDSLELPAHKAVVLKPGGFHVMLMDLKVALPKDGSIPLTLVFKDAKGTETRTEIKVPVSAAAPGGKAAAGGHGDHKH